MKKSLFLVLVAALFSSMGCGEAPDTSDADLMDGSNTEDDAGTDAGPVVLCAADSECDDGRYCNGAETCVPGTADAAPDGCVPGDAPCDAGTEICDESAETCVASGCEGTEADLDGDGDARIACGGSDCDDANANVYGTAQEVCDAEGLDEDCDPSTIYDDTSGSTDGDADADGYISNSCFNTRPDGTVNRGTDCDDASGDVHPGVTDGCGGGDADCDMMIDEDPDRTFFEDIDGDGFGIVSSTITACSAPRGYAVNDGDCDDTNRNINPSRGEPCNGIDDDCSGVADDPTTGPACTCVDGEEQPCGPTTDVGACEFGRSRCVSGAWGTCSGEVSPRAETCALGDEDCDGFSDDLDSDIGSGDPALTGALEWWRDMDTDGRGTSTDRVFACVRPTGYVAASAVSDCDDMDGLVYPGAPELCNGVNDNCDMVIDEGCECMNGTVEVCPTGSEVGECVRGNRTCSAGRWLPCDGVVATAEVCNGRDDDCDGSDDEDFACVRSEVSTGTTMCGNPGTRTCTSSCTWATPGFQAAESAANCDYCDDTGTGTVQEVPFAVVDWSVLWNGVPLEDWNAFGDGGGFGVYILPGAIPRSAITLNDRANGRGGVYRPTTIRVGYGMITVSAVTYPRSADSNPEGNWSLVVLESPASDYVSSGVGALPVNSPGTAFTWDFTWSGVTMYRLQGDGSAPVSPSSGSSTGGAWSSGSSQTLTIELTPDDPRTTAMDETEMRWRSPFGPADDVYCRNRETLFRCGFVLTPGQEIEIGATGWGSPSNDVAIPLAEIDVSVTSACGAP